MLIGLGHCLNQRRAHVRYGLVRADGLSGIIWALGNGAERHNFLGRSDAGGGFNYRSAGHCERRSVGLQTVALKPRGSSAIHSI